MSLPAGIRTARQALADLLPALLASGGTLLPDCGRRSIYFRRKVRFLNDQGCDEASSSTNSISGGRSSCPVNKPVVAKRRVGPAV